MRGSALHPVGWTVFAALTCLAQPVQAGQTPPPPAPHEMPQPPPGQRDYPSLRLSGFADVNFSGTKHLEGPRGFSLGQLALHFTSELSPRVTFFGEVSFSARTDAGTGTPAATCSPPRAAGSIAK